MAREMQSLRAADADREKIAGRLKAALGEGRLSLYEYDQRVRDAYAARTYAELRVLVNDLPRPKKRPATLYVLWTIWAALSVVNLMVWVLVSASVSGDVYPWPVWMAVPGVALLVVTVGVQHIRHQG